MLAGQQPFKGENQWAVMNAIRNREPVSASSLRGEIPSEVEQVVVRALDKTRAERYGSVHQFLREAKDCHTTLTLPVSTRPASSADLRRALLTPAGVLSGVVVAGLLALGAYWFTTRDADVFYKPFAAVDEEWFHLGTTPIDAARVPRGVLRWKIEQDGFETAEFVRPAGGRGGLPAVLPLSEEGSLPDRMLSVPASNMALDLSGFNFMDRRPAPAYLVDKYEVTNRQFKEFVDSGGYETREYWTEELVRDGERLSWEDAMAEFRDRTGRPGPSTWEVGTYPQDREDYPVGGVSWYEAAAYAEFVGKSLPTVYHWAHAAGTRQAAAITPLSNANARGLLPVGASQGVSPWGAYDMSGNVREWCWNELAAGQTRYILGGSWADPEYLFVFPQAVSPFDRSDTNGFRLVQYGDDEPAPDAFTAPVALPLRDYSTEEPASDDVFEVYRNLFAYDPAPFEPVIESVEEGEHWRTETISFNASYNEERVPAYLFVPNDAEAPYQPILYFPGATAVIRGSRSASSADVLPPTFLMASGRAVLYPIYKGTYERNDGQSTPWPEMTRAFRDWVIQFVQDARRSVDYLETRSDIDVGTLGYYGISWGSAMGPIILGLDQRFKAAVFHAGGLVEASYPAEVDPFNFAPRVSIPVLMTNGDEDFIFDLERSQKPLFDLLGSPAGQKTRNSSGPVECWH